MPLIIFLAAAGLALIALLFVADATLEKGSPPIVTSQRSGLQKPPPRHPDTIQVLTTMPAPVPDMTSQAVLTAQPKSLPDPAARAAWAEAPRENKRVMQPIDYQQSHLVDRFSIRGQ
jgi:hypothetical protein